MCFEGLQVSHLVPHVEEHPGSNNGAPWLGFDAVDGVPNPPGHPPLIKRLDSCVASKGDKLLQGYQILPDLQ